MTKTNETMNLAEEGLKAVGTHENPVPQELFHHFDADKEPYIHPYTSG